MTPNFSLWDRSSSGVHLAQDKLVTGLVQGANAPVLPKISPGFQQQGIKRPGSFAKTCPFIRWQDEEFPPTTPARLTFFLRLLCRLLTAFDPYCLSFGPDGLIDHPALVTEFFGYYSSYLFLPQGVIVQPCSHGDQVLFRLFLAGALKITQPWQLAPHQIQGQ